MHPCPVRQVTPSSLARPKPGSPIPVEATHRVYELARFASPSRPMRACFLADHRRRLQNGWHSLVFAITTMLLLYKPANERTWATFSCTMNYPPITHILTYPPTHYSLCMATAFLRAL